MTEDELVSVLSKLAQSVDGIVIHPDVMEVVDRYRVLGPKLLIENMDARKSTGRTREELDPIFGGLPDAGFCFDIAHAWSIDPEMHVAVELLNGLGARLRQVHLSSLSSGLHHVPLTADDERHFDAALSRCRDVPWILEAPPPGRWTAAGAGVTRPAEA